MLTMVKYFILISWIIQVKINRIDLLMENSYYFKDDKNKVLAIEVFQLHISIDKPLLTDLFR
jgi:hypothetical protein